jgi:hypothetical protein
VVAGLRGRYSPTRQTGGAEQCGASLAHQRRWGLPGLVAFDFHRMDVRNGLLIESAGIVDLAEGKRPGRFGGETSWETACSAWRRMIGNSLFHRTLHNSVGRSKHFRVRFVLEHEQFRELVQNERGRESLVKKERSKTMNDQATSLEGNSAKQSGPFLGIGMIVSATGFAMLFTDDPSFGYKIGSSLGQILGSAILALPIFLIWRYATRNGRMAKISRSFNIFATILVVTWFLLFFVAKNLLPSFAAGYNDGRASVHESK